MYYKIFILFDYCINSNLVEYYEVKQDIYKKFLFNISIKEPSVIEEI